MRLVKRYYSNDVDIENKAIDIFDCPDCGFEFNAIHEVDEQVGGWECPLCEVDEKQKEIERLQSFIETLHVVHFTELQREKATVERYEKALKYISKIEQPDGGYVSRLDVAVTKAKSTLNG